jgi:hypothetical protein
MRVGLHPNFFHFCKQRIGLLHLPNTNNHNGRQKQLESYNPSYVLTIACNLFWAPKSICGHHKLKQRMSTRVREVKKKQWTRWQGTVARAEHCESGKQGPYIPQLHTCIDKRTVSHYWWLHTQPAHCRLHLKCLLTSTNFQCVRLRRTHFNGCWPSLNYSEPSPHPTKNLFSVFVLKKRNFCSSPDLLSIYEEMSLPALNGTPSRFCYLSNAHWFSGKDKISSVKCTSSTMLQRPNSRMKGLNEKVDNSNPLCCISSKKSKPRDTWHHSNTQDGT